MAASKRQFKVCALVHLLLPMKDTTKAQTTGPIHSGPRRSSVAGGAKTRLHPRNKNREPYDLNALSIAVPELREHLIVTDHGAASIDFADPRAVKHLNKALLKHYYGIKTWDFPEENLCPPVPGRADYLHHIADLLAGTNSGTVPLGDKITCLDIGTGASCIYPIIGVTEYGWNFIASDIAAGSIASAEQIIRSNPSLLGKVECRVQKDPKAIFHGILNKEEKIDVTMCNPPFHASLEDAQRGTRRKIKNLSGKSSNTPALNFSGISRELIYEGGEHQFIQKMIWESRAFPKSCLWFTTLVSKGSNLQGILSSLEKSEAQQIRTIIMGTGNKVSRIVAWTFLSGEEHKEWKARRWE